MNRLARFSLTIGKLLLATNALTLGLFAKIDLKIAAAEELIEDFKTWTSVTPWEKIETYDHPHAHRPVVDFVLQLKALKAGGLDFAFEFVPCPSYEEAKHAVLDGKADLAAETIWGNEIDANKALLEETAPVIRRGEFNKGIYVLPSNRLILGTSSLEELQKHRGLVVETWHTDRQTLRLMRLQGIETSPTLRKVGPLLQEHNADFVLMEFSSAPDMSIKLGGVTLVPIPNCKVAIAHGRSWIIAKYSPHCDALYPALEKGITALRAAGTIEKAYTESGFFHPGTKLWRQLF